MQIYKRNFYKKVFIDVMLNTSINHHLFNSNNYKFDLWKKYMSHYVTVFVRK